MGSVCESGVCVQIENNDGVAEKCGGWCAARSSVLRYVCARVFGAAQRESLYRRAFTSTRHLQLGSQLNTPCHHSTPPPVVWVCVSAPPHQQTSVDSTVSRPNTAQDHALSCCQTSQLISQLRSRLLVLAGAFWCCQISFERAAADSLALFSSHLSFKATTQLQPHPQQQPQPCCTAAAVKQHKQLRAADRLPSDACCDLLSRRSAAWPCARCLAVCNVLSVWVATHQTARAAAAESATYAHKQPGV